MREKASTATHMDGNSPQEREPGELEDDPINELSNEVTNEMQKLEQPYDPALDFFSREFSAEKALKTLWLEPPNPKVLPLDNLNKCRYILPAACEESMQNFTPRPERSEASKIAQERAIQRSEHMKAQANALTPQSEAIHDLTSKFKEGPLSLLLKWYQTHERVRVVTRHQSGVRGWCTGSLQAFDKYMNLVLKNVQEEYTVLLNVEREIVGKDGKTRVRRGRRQDHRKRTLGQIFILGSAIVMISKAEGLKAIKS
jgi:small nuclear ribonucleoprotein (snRNP)-like protein